MRVALGQFLVGVGAVLVADTWRTWLSWRGPRQVTLRTMGQHVLWYAQAGTLAVECEDESEPEETFGSDAMHSSDFFDRGDGTAIRTRMADEVDEATEHAIGTAVGELEREIRRIMGDRFGAIRVQIRAVDDDEA